MNAEEALQAQKNNANSSCCPQKRKTEGRRLEAPTRGGIVLPPTTFAPPSGQTPQRNQVQPVGAVGKGNSLGVHLPASATNVDTSRIAWSNYRPPQPHPRGLRRHGTQVVEILRSCKINGKNGGMSPTSELLHGGKLRGNWQPQKPREWGTHPQNRTLSRQAEKIAINLGPR